MKTCTRCNNRRPSDEFYKSPNNSDGLRTWCKTCLADYHIERYAIKKDHINAVNRKYRVENADKVKRADRERARQRYADDPEKHKRAVREYNLHHPEKHRDYARAYRAAGKVNKEKMREYQRAYRERHRDEIAQRHRVHVEANREKIRMRMSNVKAQRRMAEGKVTTKEWKAILLFYGNSCGLCRVSASELPMTVDHFIPLSKDGTNTWDNVWPLCMPCNVRKHATIPTEDCPPHVDIFRKTGTFD